MGDDSKDVAYYSAQVNAWLSTQFEHDKSLLTLSAGGIGLLITLLSTIGIRSVETLILYGLALLSFCICLGTLLWIFRRNAKHLEDVVANKAENDPILAVLDNVAISTFLLGVIFSSVIGVSTAVTSYQERNSQMAKNDSLEEKIQKVISGQTQIQESLNGINKMAPGMGREQCSVDGISKMNPSNLAPKPAPATNTNKGENTNTNK